MKRSVQEIVELVVFGAIALLIGTGVLWLTGWIFTGAGWLALAITGLLWRVLIVLVPLVIVAGLIYWLVNYMMKQRREQAAAAGTAGIPSAASTSARPPAGDPHPAGNGTHVTDAAVTTGSEVVPDTVTAGDPADQWAAGTEPTTVPAEPAPPEPASGPVAPAEPVVDEAMPGETVPMAPVPDETVPGPTVPAEPVPDELAAEPALPAEPASHDEPPAPAVAPEPVPGEFVPAEPVYGDQASESASADRPAETGSAPEPVAPADEADRTDNPDDDPDRPLRNG